MMCGSGIGIINNELSYQKIKKVNSLNISGFCQAISWSFNFFVKQKHGHIVNISSVASEIGGGISPVVAEGALSLVKKKLPFKCKTIKQRKITG